MGDEFFVGTIIPVPYYNFVPDGTVKCNGQLLSCMQYQVLFSLLGNTFGGTSPNTFAVPNLQGFEPNPKVYYVITTSGYYPTRP